MDVDPKTLDPKKTDRLRPKWTPTWNDANSVLHAEMQLVLFYALDSQLSPIQGYRGGKECCCCCGFVLGWVTFSFALLSPGW